MWEMHSEALNTNVSKHVITERGIPLTNAQVIRNLAGSDEFNDYISTVLASSPFPAFFWECAPLSRSRLGLPFEFVLSNSTQLVNVRADPAAFMPYCNHRPVGESIVRFDNLGGDAVLVAPCPFASDSAWPHLADFVRDAPALIKREFWSCAGAALIENMDQRPLWLSTSGLGVYWLHLRLDTRPKYYTYEPYRRMA
jgi:Family of unknown function (DUF6940)